jgi:hypothetical protein
MHNACLKKEKGMKKLIALVLVLVTANAFAVSTNRTWHAGGEKLKMVGKLSIMSGYTTEQEAVDASFDLAEELQSGNPSQTAFNKFRNAPTLWDSNDKCRSTVGSRKGLLIREMAKGNFKIKSVTVGSYYNGQGLKVFSSKITYYAPCVMKD